MTSLSLAFENSKKKEPHSLLFKGFSPLINKREQGSCYLDKF